MVGAVRGGAGLARPNMSVDLGDLLVKSVGVGLVLTMQPLDHLVGRLVSLEIRMVPIAEQELPVGSRVRTDPPTARFVTVVLPHDLVHAGGDRSDQADLGQVGPESRPEPVPGAGQIVDAG